MSSKVRTRFRRLAANPLLAACAAVLVVLALAAPVVAAEGPTKLFQPNVSPRAGTTSTRIVFTVWYRNREGSAPDHVSAVVDGVAHAMTAHGSDWRDGVRFTWSTRLRAGSHAIDFVAADTRRFSDRVGAGSVTISAPAPAPTPRPEPTPTPAPNSGSGGTGAGPAPTTGAGSASGGDTPTDPAAGAGTSGGEAAAPDGSGGPNELTWLVLPGSTGPDGTGGWHGPSGGAGGTDPDAGHPGWPGWAPAGDAPAGGSEAAGGSDGAETTGATDTSSAGGSTAGGGIATSGGPGWGSLAAALRTLGIREPGVLTVLPMLVGTTGAITMAFAFAIFGKKRRDEAPPAPDEVLQANAARGHEPVQGGEVVRTVAIPAPLDLEAGMPRWRRPSVQAARKADPSRTVGMNQPMTFDTGIVSAVDGRERRVIRYAVVRLLDAPDELRSSEIGQLDKGDEVQLIERSGSYWLVLCPNGQQGWIHKMTLGEIVSDATPSFSRDVDDDVLAAFLDARARA